MPPRNRTVDRLRGLRGIGVDRIGAAADEAARRLPDVLRLENLDTDLRPPALALQTTREAVTGDENNSYLPFLGQSRLRQAVARRVGRLAGVEYDPDRECLITAGGLNGCLVTLLALIEGGDEVLLLDPTYVGMINRVRLAGGSPVLVPFHWRGGEWRLDLEAWRQALSPKTRAVFVMNPCMPSGAVLNASEWEAIASACREADLWLIYNAAMERILFDGRPPFHPACLGGMAERTITIGSVSKEFRMIGWRVGWVVGPVEALTRTALVSMSDVVVPVGIAQGAAASVLEAAGADAEIAVAVGEWQRRRDVVTAELSGPCVRPAAGGWSLLFDVSPWRLNGDEAAARLLELAHVAVTPMKNWGIKNADAFVWIVFSNEPVERLVGLGKRFDQALRGAR